MARIKIKCRSNTRDEKLKLIEIFGTREIEVSGFIPTHDGFVALTLSEEHADSIFNAQNKEYLESQGFRPIMPPELKVKKSVIIQRVEDVIYEKNVVDIGQQLEDHNSWIGEGGISDIYKFPNSYTLKVTFSMTTLAQKCLETGIKAFGISIPANMIKQETYIPVKCCMRCYVLEQHYTSECPRSKEFKICSECSDDGHVWHECQSDTKKCLNCNGKHSSMAMRCPKRKEIIKEKRSQINEREKLSFATVSKIIPSATSMTMPQMPSVTKEELLKIHTCVAHAQNKEQIKPGTYKYELNRVLKANNLPTIIIPDDEQERNSDNTHKQTTSAVAVNVNEQGAESQLKPSNIQRTKSTETLSSKVIDAEDIGLEIYTTKERGWPNNMTNTDLTTGIERKIYKGKYTASKFTEEQIMRKIRRNEINLSNSNCFITVDTEAFRKIRPGLNADRSPVPSRDPRRKQLSSHSTIT